MTRRIGLLGGECTGKSVLAAALEIELGACVVPERLRAFVDTHGRVPLQHEQAQLMREQMEAEEAAARACPSDWVVCDPAPLMTAVYSEMYFDDSALTAAGVAHARTYDVLLWCDDDIPWVPDGMMRDGSDYRSREQAIVERIVRGADLQVTMVSGSVEERVRTALEACALSSP